MLRKLLVVCIILCLLGCMPAAPQTISELESADSTGTFTPTLPPPTQTEKPPTPTATSVPPTATLTVAPTDTASPTVTSTPALQAMGPDDFPSDVNPLTGLVVPDPAQLQVAPVLVSITDSPLTARPQAGLSFSSFVYEFYIGEGATRFLSVFYANPPTQGVDGKVESDSVKVGPIRSGRMLYESLRKLYNGFLVFAGATQFILARLTNYQVVYGSQTIDINHAFISVEGMKNLAASGARKFVPSTMTGLRFDPQAPPNGLPATKLWVPYNLRCQVRWIYDPSTGYYHRYQDQDDATTFVEATDRLNGKPLQFSNVIVLFTEIHFYDPTLFSTDLMNITKREALLFRDGKMYPIFWKTAVDDYSRHTGLLRPPRFVDAQGNPFPLKPGQTWVEIVPRFTPYFESADELDYWGLINHKQPGSGVWTVQFIAPAPELPDDLSGVPMP
ncbi:MAG: DUF3048 C-terminal domain-containing protein [Anaerolineaceae bacterium]